MSSLARETTHHADGKLSIICSLHSKGNLTGHTSCWTNKLLTTSYYTHTHTQSTSYNVPCALLYSTDAFLRHVRSGSEVGIARPIPSVSPLTLSCHVARCCHARAPCVQPHPQIEPWRATSACVVLGIITNSEDAVPSPSYKCTCNRGQAGTRKDREYTR